MNRATGVAIVMIVMRHRRNRQRSALRVSGFERPRAGRELVLVNQRAVIGAADVRGQEQVPRAPDVTKEREHRERGDERLPRSPAARLS